MVKDSDPVTRLMIAIASPNDQAHRTLIAYSGPRVSSAANEITLRQIRGGCLRVDCIIP